MAMSALRCSAATCGLAPYQTQWPQSSVLRPATGSERLLEEVLDDLLGDAALLEGVQAKEAGRGKVIAEIGGDFLVGELLAVDVGGPGCRRGGSGGRHCGDGSGEKECACDCGAC